ncbi:hypothetical protein [Catenulispora rubra]|uniref:hypothetical protein n=1 Tax=Catenulispora rubra TaxID=280293 RepID=UPI001891F733|nr:hypothetical protein [Catenulispora rubra]
MTIPADTGADTAPTMGGACHAMLLRLAGRVPDGLLAQTRAWLATHEVELLARAVVAGVAAAGLTLAPDDTALLRWILETAGLDTTPLDQIVLMEDADTPVKHVFAPAAPEVMERRGDEFGPCVDLSALAMEDRADLTDELDRAAVTAAVELPGTVALWRSWRQPADGAPQPAPRRVFLPAVADAESSWTTTAAFQQQLAALGEISPQVETFGTDQLLPTYQRTARSSSALLWTAAPSEPMRLAPVYDTVDGDDTPGFAADRARLADIDRVVVADLLDGGAVVLSTTAYLDDVLNPGRRIPVNFRTDGFWVWNDAAAYYAREHGIAPIAALLDHLRSDRPRTQPDTVALFRATAALTQP